MTLIDVSIAYSGAGMERIIKAFLLLSLIIGGFACFLPGADESYVGDTPSQVIIKEKKGELGELLERREGYYNNSNEFIYHGLSEFWHFSSRVKYKEMSYLHGRLDGPFLTWFPNGERESYGLMKEGKMVGDHTIYIPGHRYSVNQRYDDSGTIEKEVVKVNKPGEKVVEYAVVYESGQPWDGKKVDVMDKEGKHKLVLKSYKEGKIHDVLELPDLTMDIWQHPFDEYLKILPKMSLDVKDVTLEELALIVNRLDPRVRLIIGEGVDTNELVSVAADQKHEVGRMLHYISKSLGVNMQVAEIQFIMTAANGDSHPSRDEDEDRPNPDDEP